jgi:hypothetical protein
MQLINVPQLVTAHVQNLTSSSLRIYCLSLQQLIPFRDYYNNDQRESPSIARYPPEMRPCSAIHFHVLIVAKPQLADSTRKSPGQPLKPDTRARMCPITRQHLTRASRVQNEA